MYRVDIYLETSSRYLGVKERWGGYVITYILQNGELVSVEGFERVEGTYNHAVLHMLNLAMERIKKQSTVHIHSANSYILDMINNNLPAWAEFGFQNQKGKPVKDREEWKELWRKKGENRHIFLTEKGTHEFSQWMLDELAKQGQHLDNSEKPQKDKTEEK